MGWRKGAPGRGVIVAGSDAQERFDFLAVGHTAIEDALVILAENLGGTFHLGLGTFNFQIVVAEMRSDVQRRLEEFQVFVKGTEEFVDATG